MPLQQERLEQTQQKWNDECDSILDRLETQYPEDLDVVFDELSIDRQIIRMRVYAESFESADRLGAELAKFPPFAQARIGSIESDPKRGGKRFDVTISLAPREDSR